MSTLLRRRPKLWKDDPDDDNVEKAIVSQISTRRPIAKVSKLHSSFLACFVVLASILMDSKTTTMALSPTIPVTNPFSSSLSSTCSSSLLKQLQTPPQQYSKSQLLSKPSFPKHVATIHGNIHEYASSSSACCTMKISDTAMFLQGSSLLSISSFQNRNNYHDWTGGDSGNNHEQEQQQQHYNQHRDRTRGILGFQVMGGSSSSSSSDHHHIMSMSSTEHASAKKDCNPKKEKISSSKIWAPTRRKMGSREKTLSMPWQHMGEPNNNNNYNYQDEDDEEEDDDEEDEEGIDQGTLSWTDLSSWSSDNSINRQLVEPRKESSNTAAPTPHDLLVPWVPSNRQIEALTVVQLKAALADRGLSRTGRKTELQHRLSQWTAKRRATRKELTSNPLYSAYGVPSTRESIPSRPDKKPALRRSGDSTVMPNNNEAIETQWLEKDSDLDEDEAFESKYAGLFPSSSLAHLEPLFSRREAIHREKQEGKHFRKQLDNVDHSSSLPIQSSSSVISKDEYISVLKKVFDDSSSSRYSNYEVKQIYAAAKEADQMGDRILSKRILAELKEATPHDMRIYRRLSRMEKEEGDLVAAKAILQEGLGLDPKNAFLWHGLAQLATSDLEAKQYYRKAIQSNPSLPMPYHALGTLEHSQGRIANAMKTLKEGLEYCPTNHRLHHALGDLYRDAKLLDMAEKSYRKALQHGPEVSHGFAYNALAYVAYENGKPDQCRAWLRKAISLNDGRHANSWVALAQMEEAEGNIEKARNVCLAGISKYERGLLSKWIKSHNIPELSNSKVDRYSATKIRNRLMTRVPVYRSGDRFFNVYRNWARLEERYGSSESVEEVYQRAFLAFPREWKLTIDWAQHYAKLNLYERADELFTAACSQSRGKHADPFRFHAEYEMMARGNYEKAQRILQSGAMAISEKTGADLVNRNGIVELYYVWAICEWHLENLSVAEDLLDQALRMVTSGEEGSEMRSLIFYAKAKLMQYQNKPTLAQHFIGLCLKEESRIMRVNTYKVWDLWAVVANDLGNTELSAQCQTIADQAKHDTAPNSMMDLVSPHMQHLMRRDPWHAKIFGTPNNPQQQQQQRSTSFHAIRLPLLPSEEQGACV